MECKCKIQWVDNRGKPTPDDSPAVGFARTIGYPVKENPFYRPTPSEWFPICADHLRKLPLDGHWEFLTTHPDDLAAELAALRRVAEAARPGLSILEDHGEMFEEFSESKHDDWAGYRVETDGACAALRSALSDLDKVGD